MSLLLINGVYANCYIWEKMKVPESIEEISQYGSLNVNYIYQDVCIQWKPNEILKISGSFRTKYYDNLGCTSVEACPNSEAVCSSVEDCPGNGNWIYGEDELNKESAFYQFFCNNRICDEGEITNECKDNSVCECDKTKIPYVCKQVESSSTNNYQQTSHTNENYFIYLIILVIFVFLTFFLIKNKLYKKIILKIYYPGEKRNKEEKLETKEVQKEETIPQNITTAISVSNFTVNYGSKSILSNVNFKIDRGKFVSIIGTSGTGKSTIIESLVGRKKPNEGKILIFNKGLKESLQHIGFVPQSMELYLNQTVLQNLKSSATKYGITISDSEIDKILNKINLINRKDLKANNLSGGQKKLLSLGMELIKNPELLILDEPTTGLDPNSRNQIITALSQLVNHSKKTVVITTHFMDDCEECDEIIIVHDKGIVAQDTPQRLERRLPGSGKVVNIVLDNVTDDLLKKIKKIQGIENIIREGRSLKILTNEPNAVKLSQKIDELGGSILEAKLVNATMKEVFVYYTGEELKDV